MSDDPSLKPLNLRLFIIFWFKNLKSWDRGRQALNLGRRTGKYFNVMPCLKKYKNLLTYQQQNFLKQQIVPFNT